MPAAVALEAGADVNHGKSLDDNSESHGSVDSSMDALLRPAIVLKRSTQGSSVSYTLQPLMLLPRAYLPLSCLDLLDPHAGLVRSQAFESSIRILELEGRLGNTLLLAKSARTGFTYAIERHGSGAYVACKLGNWVDYQDLAQHAAALCKERLPTMVQSGLQEAHLTTPQIHKVDKRKRLAIEELQSMVRKRPRELESTAFETQAGSSQPETQMLQKAFIVSVMDKVLDLPPAQPGTAIRPVVVDPSAASAAEAVADVAQDTAQAIFANIRAQYLEILYHSMGSLAYFAKGPLSRARAAFHLDVDAALDMEDLISFLKKLLLTAQQSDKKFRDAIPALLEGMKSQVDGSDAERRKRKRREALNVKIGKDGLISGETEHVQKWWASRMPSTQDERASHAITADSRFHVSELRTRETQMQLLLVLEIMALEDLRPSGNGQEPQLPGSILNEAAADSKSVKTSKSRSKHNLPTLLDLHADRLCIWQSTALDAAKFMAESQNLEQAQTSQTTKEVKSNTLRDFCVDVLLPFYAPRLPGVYKTLNRKFGGPSSSSASHAKSAKVAAKFIETSKSTTDFKKPRPTTAKPPRTLERVLSNEASQRRASQRPLDAVARMRSATPAAIPGLKQEESGPFTLLAGTRDRRGSHRDDSRRTLSRSQSACSIDELKAQKKAAMDAELREAITALKKPNRQLAGRAVLDEAEKRTAAAAAKTNKKLRKPLHPTRVQVMATPANNRFKEVAAAETQNMPPINLVLAEEDDVIPPSSCVPSTAQRPKGPSHGSHQHLSDTGLTGAIKGTPLKLSAWATSSRKMRLEDMDEIPASSPLQPMRTSKVQQLRQTRLFAAELDGTRNVLAVDVSPGLHDTPTGETPSKLRTSYFDENVMASTPPPPLLRSDVAAAGEDSSLAMTPPEPPTSSALASGEREIPGTPEMPVLSKPAPNIYQRLGWDDDDLDEIAL